MRINRLDAENLTIAIAGRTIVEAVSFSAGAGQLIGLIGPNGAGKTTLLRALLRLQPLGRGTIRLDGRDITKVPAHGLATTIAYLPQGNLVHWPITVERLVALGRLPHLNAWTRASAEDQRLIDWAIEATDIGALRGRVATTLSGGERARVLMARALAVDAPVLMADEPVAALDPYHQIVVMDVLAAAARTGKTVIVVLHDLSLAARYCDRLVLLDGGRLVADGPPPAVLTAETLAAVYNIAAHRHFANGESFVVPLRRTDCP